MTPRETWVLGTGAAARNDTLAGLDAPDFALPDLAGMPRRLSDLRGKQGLPHHLGVLVRLSL